MSKMTQELSSILPHHIPSFLQSKSCWNPGEWHTHSLSASTSPKPAKPESSQPARNPPALTLHSSPSLEMILERRLLRIYVPQNARDATNTLIQTLMNYPYPLVPLPPLSSGSSSILKQFPHLLSVLPRSVRLAWPEPASTSRQAWFHLCRNSFHQNSRLLFWISFTVLKSAEKRYLRNCKLTTSIDESWLMSTTVLQTLFYTVN